MADRVGRHERAIEVHALDDCVDGEHLDAIALGFDDRRIVADADEEPVGRRREMFADARDELGFGEGGDSRQGRRAIGSGKLSAWIRLPPPSKLGPYFA